MKMVPPFLFIVLSIIFQALSGIFGKLAAISTSGATPVSIITNYFFLLVLLCLLLQAIVWQQALIHFPLSFAYPYISITNFVVLFSAAALFQENITLMNIAGLILVTVGIFWLFHSHEAST